MLAHTIHNVSISPIWARMPDCQIIYDIFDLTRDWELSDKFMTERIAELRETVAEFISDRVQFSCSAQIRFENEFQSVSAQKFNRIRERKLR